MKFQQKFLVALSSLLIVFPVKTAFNCIESFSSDQIRVVHFFKDIFEFNDLFPFIYETEHFLYSNEALEKKLSEADRLNISEWKIKMNDPQISEKDIVSFLYELSPATYWKHKDEWDRNNRFLYVAKTKYPAVYTYLQFVKEVEMTIGYGTANVWDDGHPGYTESLPGTSAGLRDEDSQHKRSGQFIPLAHDLLTRTTDPFLKRRYAYKILSLGFYTVAGIENKSNRLIAFEEFANLFDTYFRDGKKDWMYYSALHYYGQIKGEEYLLESYMYGKDKRARTAIILSRQFMETTIAHNKDPKKVATCLAIQSLSNPGRNLKNLQKIYALDPQNRDFNFLVSREVNKLENWLWTEKMSKLPFDAYLYYDEETRQYELNYKSDKVYSAQVERFFKQVYKDARLTEENRLFLSVAIAYIEVVNGNADAGAKFLELNAYKNPKYQLQAKVINLLLRMQVKEADDAFENELLSVLDEIRLCRLFDAPSLYMQQLIRTVSEYYKTQPALRARGFLLSSRTSLARSGSFFMDDVYENATVTDIDGMFAIIRKKDKSVFEQFITRGNADYYWNWDYFTTGVEEQLTPLDTMTLLDYKGLRLMREDKLEQALAVYAPLSDSVLNKEPFSYVRDDVFIFRNRHYGEFLYNKKTFLEQLISYKQQLAKDPNNALIGFYVGNAYLNMTIHGNAWPMMSNYISSDVEDREYARTIGHHYIYGDRAVPYFSKALAHVTDPKLKALIQINLGYIKSIRIDDEKAQLTALRKLCANKAEQELLLEVYSNCDVYYDYTQQYMRKGYRVAPIRDWAYSYY